MKMLRLTAAATAFALASLAWAAPENYKIDPVHSFVVFNIGHMNIGRAYGTFNKFEGNLVYDKEDAANSSVELKIDANSVDTNNSKRDEHVRNPDFLNTAQYPTITYKSDSVRKLGENQYEVTGQLNLHGTTKTVTAKLEKLGEATDPKGVQRVGGEAKFSFKRSDFGMTNMLDNLGDEINVIVAIEAIRQEPAAGQNAE